MKKKITVFLAVLCAFMSLSISVYADNPVIKDRFSADPAALVHDGKVYLYTGHDEARPSGNTFVMREWNIHSSEDLVNWKLEGHLPRTAFKWAQRDSAWASQVVERDGQFYWYVTVFNGDPADPGYSIGVAQSEHPVKGFRDALGGPLIAPSMTANPEYMGTVPWDDIDPTVFVDKDDQAYLYWGNTHLYYVKLKDNMIELDSEIRRVEIANMPVGFTEAPWLHERDGLYYLTYALNYPEELGYAMSDNPAGPWTYKGKLMDKLPGSSTSHPAIIQFEEQWYFIYHSAALPTGGEFRRATSIEKMVYNPNGTIQKIVPTASGISDDSYLLQTYSNTDHYVRHMGMGLQIAAIKKDDSNFKWHVVPGLADYDEAYISFQSDTRPGFYMKRKDEQLVMAKHDGTDSFKEAATFRVIPGLADKTASSYQAYGDELYLYHDANNQLTLATMTVAQDNERATFRLKGEESDTDKAEVSKEADVLSKVVNANYVLVGLIVLGLVITVIVYVRRKRK
ncbi:family 43 glycosylhydrolase [Sporosarcina sp. FSL K6-3457]|uniref:family 43 glycosylhydrolase n=1 Tax=Sporosarcina sp. FSL K6-3457 TaxID=2978204 RepID=UPI0030FA37AB